MRFLELAVQCDDILASLAFYRQLGFVELTTNDGNDYGYAVVSDGRVCIGLHNKPEFPMALRFVKENVRKMVLDLSEANIEFDDVRLGEDELHQASLSGPYGNTISWVEARTFSPPDSDIDESLLGRFLEVSLPVSEVYTAARFWAPYSSRVLGDDGQSGHMRLDTGGINLGLCEHSGRASPVLTFELRDAGQLQACMDQFGILPSRKPKPEGAFAALDAPEGTGIVLYREDFLSLES